MSAPLAGRGKTLLDDPDPGSTDARSATQFIGALLAGGAGSRFGGPKQEARLGGMALWEHPARALEAVTPECIQIGGPPIAAFSWPIWPDLREGMGPAAGIETALALGERPIVAIALDLPFVPPELLRTAAGLLDEGALAAAPRWGDRWHPLCAAYGLGALELLQTRLDNGDGDLHGLLDLIGTPIDGDELEALGDPDVMLFNVNTQEDLATAERILGGSDL